MLTLLFDVYCEQELTPGALAGEPPEFDIDINNLMRRFALLRVESGCLIFDKLVQPGTVLKFVAFEEIFDTIHD